MNANKNRLWIASACLTLAMVAMALIQSGCAGSAPAQSDSKAPKPIEVTVINPTSRMVTDYEEFTGRVDAVNKVAVQAMVTGYLVKANFIDGDDVDENQVLFNIDPRVFKANENLAKATREQAEAHFKRLSFDFDRDTKLLQSSALARSDFDKTTGDRLEAKAAVGQAEAQVEQAELNVKFSKVESPLKGRVSRRLVDPGNMVKANETTLTWVYQIDPMYGYFDVDERTVIKLRRLVNEGKLRSYRDGMTDDKKRSYVEIGLADEEGFSVKNAYINWVDNVLDAGTGTLKLRCVIDQPRDSSGKPMVLFSPNMFVRMKLPISTPRSVLLIPEKAVGTDQGDKFVYILNSENKVEQVKVRLGQLHDKMRVVEMGGTRELLPTDRVIVDNLQRVRPGPDQPPVAVKNAPAKEKAAD
jgi:RND family efflux transporter MFP subunit